MLLLLKAALRNRKHLSLLLFSFLALGLLTISNALEISALGVLINADTLSQLMSGQPLEAPTLELIGSHKTTNPLQWIIERVQQQMVNVSSLRVLIGILVSVAVFKAICLFWSRFMTQLMAIRVSRDLRLQYFEHIQTLPMSFYQKHNIGSLSSRVVGDAGQIATSINSILTNYLHTPFTIILTLILCFYISWQLSMVIFFGIPMIVLPITFLAKRVKRASRQLQSNQERFASVLIDFLAGIQTLKIFAMESFSLKKYKEQNDRMAVLESKAAKYGLLTRPILHMMTTLCLASVVLYGLLTLKLTVSELIVFCGLLQLSYEAIKKFADENANIQRGVVAAERMFDVLNLIPEIEDKKDAILLTGFKEKIEFDSRLVPLSRRMDPQRRQHFTILKEEKPSPLLVQRAPGKSTHCSAAAFVFMKSSKARSGSMENRSMPILKDRFATRLPLFLKNRSFSTTRLLPISPLAATFPVMTSTQQPNGPMLTSLLSASRKSTIRCLLKRDKISLAANSNALRLQELLLKTLQS